MLPIVSGGISRHDSDEYDNNDEIDEIEHFEWPWME
jgi:hypothetical protein